MKTSVQLVAFLAVCAFASFPLLAQDDMGVPAPPPPSQQDSPYIMYPDPGAPAPDQQAPPDQQGAPDQQGGPDQATGDQPATFQTFYDNLAPQGTWIQSSDYGYVWQPAVNDPDWAPYTAGHWVYSDAGWTWVTDEPWGWATYHYGRWVNLNGTGWCWVPGYTWAPAWVSWRYGSGYCGWAPLPPESFIGIDYIGSGFQITAGFHIGGDCDNYYNIGAGWYHFVPVSCLGYSSYRGHYANWQNNYTIINRTTNVTNVNVNRNGWNNGSRRGFGGVTTGGPSLAQVNAASATPVPNVHLTGAHRPGGGGQLANNSLAVYAPRVAPGANHTFQPNHVGGSLGRATINRGVDVAHPPVVNPRLSVPTPTAGQIQEAQLAQNAAPPHAHVATATTSMNPALQTPLTALQPTPAVAQQRTQNGAFSNAAHPSAAPTVSAQPAQRQFNNGWGNHASGTPNVPNTAVNPGPNPASVNPNYHSWTPATTQPQSSPQPQFSPAPVNGFNRQVQQAPGFPSNGAHAQTPIPQTQVAPVNGNGFNHQFQPAQPTQTAPPHANGFNHQFQPAPGGAQNGSVIRAPVQPTPQPQAQVAPARTFTPQAQVTPTHSFTPQPQTVPSAAPSNPIVHSQAPSAQPAPAGNNSNGHQRGDHGGNDQNGNGNNGNQSGNHGGNGWNGNRQQQNH